MTIRNCQNCEQVIGGLEESYTYYGQVICKACMIKLEKQFQDPDTTNGNIETEIPIAEVRIEQDCDMKCQTPAAEEQATANIKKDTEHFEDKTSLGEDGILEANYKPQKRLIWVSVRRYTGGLLIYPIYWLTTWGAFTRVVGATLSSEKAQEQVESGIIDSVWEYGWGDHYILFLIVFYFVTYCCAVLAGATAKQRGSIIAGIANLPLVVSLSFFYFWLHMSQTEIEISSSWKIVLPVAALGSVFFSAIGGLAGQRWQVNSFGSNSILGIRPIHWWWFIFPVSLAIQTLVPKIVAALGLLIGSTLVKETKYSVMLFLIFVALATFTYFIVWGWYKTLHLLSISHKADFGRCGITLRVLFYLFAIPILGELFFVLIFLLFGGFS